MAKEITCFLIVATGRYRRSLRRYTCSTRFPGRCGGPDSIGRPPHDYHNLRTVIDTVIASESPSSGDSWPHDDPRWPRTCSCGYEFKPDDIWQVFYENIYRRADTGEECVLREAAAGAIWRADWLSTMQGSPDHESRGGRDHLICRLPGGYDWDMSGRSSNGVGWTLRGEVPKLVATPSVGKTDAEGRWLYHGFLGGSDGSKPGVLVEC